jgi:hypothetical protein
MQKEKLNTQPIKTEIYSQIATKTNSFFLPIGWVWYKLLNSNPNLNLYDGDLFGHPSLFGTYVTALVFYTFLVGHITLEKDIYLNNFCVQKSENLYLIESINKALSQLPTFLFFHQKTSRSY